MTAERWVITEVEHVGWKWTGGRPDPDGLVWRSTTPRFLDDLDLDIDPNDPGDLLLEWSVRRAPASPGHRPVVEGRRPVTIADTFAQVAASAMALDPDLLRSTILATHDRLPGGSRSSETGIRATRMERCEDRGCEHFIEEFPHDHPVPNDPTGDAAMRPSESEQDLRLLASLVHDYVTAVAELSQRSRSAPPPKEWDEAVKDHHLLVEMDAIPPLVTSWGHGKVRAWVEKVGDAVSSIEHLANRHLPRDANDHEKSWTSGLADGQCCRVCLKLGLRVQWQDGGAGGLCQGCYRLRKRCASVTDLPYEEVPDPPETLVEELRRINTPGGPADLAARSRWFQRVESEHRATVTLRGA